MAEMSALEKLLVNSPFRAWFQRGEINAFIRWGQLDSTARVLDMGCGPGVSTSLIVEKLGPQRLAAFDFDPAMVDRARRRLEHRGLDDGVDVRFADATQMPYEEGQFDAVFESGVVHHVPDWRGALREVSRVLKPGGRFCFAEPSRGRLRRGMYWLLPHASESMFDRAEWQQALADVGLELQEPLLRLPLWDICGVAERRAERGATG